MEKTYLKIIVGVAFFFAPVVSFAANLSISPASGTYEVGERFTVRVVASSPVPFNAVSLSLLTPTDMFAVDAVSKSNSLLTFWVTEPTVLNNGGLVKLEGVTPGGISATTGTVVSVTLHGTQVGTGRLSFQSGQVLANDGQGTDITGAFSGATFTITEAKPKPKPKPTVKPTVEVAPAEMAQPEPTLESPTISFGKKYDADAILGTSKFSHTQVLVTFLYSDGVKMFIMGETSDDGSFSLVIPHTLKRGTYTVTARLIKSDGTNSKDSDAILVTIGDWWSDVSSEVKWAILWLVLTILYLIARIIMHLRKDWRNKMMVRKEVKEAEKAVHETLDELREEIIHDSGNSQKISVISKKIASAEKKIDEEIKDIELE